MARRSTRKKRLRDCTAAAEGEFPSSLLLLLWIRIKILEGLPKSEFAIKGKKEEGGREGEVFCQSQESSFRQTTEEKTLPHLIGS